MKEVNVVIDCIKKLLSNVNKTKRTLSQSDIGVVTPYKLQCKVIAQACRRNGFNDITIGTAEVFQGQERPVMIVSTVRTGGVLGFVNEPRVSFNIPFTFFSKPKIVSKPIISFLSEIERGDYPCEMPVDHRWR